MSQPAEHPLKHVVVQFDLPFVLRVQDAIDGKPDDFDHYVVVIKGYPLQLRFKRLVRDIDGVRIALEDKRGLLSYSTVQVWLEPRLLTALSVPANFRKAFSQILACAIEAVNRFLELYRRETNTYWVARIVVSDLVSVTMVGRPRDGPDDPFIRGTLGTGRGLGTLVPPDADHRIREGLISGWRPTELERFGYVPDSLLARGDSWGAALAAGVFFESWFRSFFRGALEDQGLEDAAVEQRFERKDGRPRSITSLVQEYLTDHLGVDPNHPGAAIAGAYRAWERDTRDLRNALAHRRRFEVSEREAIAALESARVLMSLCKGSPL